MTGSLATSPSELRILLDQIIEEKRATRCGSQSRGERDEK
jgi:hypothetical protein